MNPPADEPINILIVDDEPKNLTVLETVLDDPGYRLFRAESAHKALLALVAGEFALLILDIRMPGMTGLELAQTIKERRKTARIPIIFLTAYYGEDQHVLEGYDSGAVDYLHKPVNATILRSKVAVFAELHRKNREVERANRTLIAEVAERLRAEEQLRALTHRVVQAQDAERGKVALELHDNISQLLIAVLFRSQALADSLTARDGPAKSEAKKLRDLLGQTVGEVQRIAHHLRPSILDQLGLVAMLRVTCTEFAQRTGVAVAFAGADLAARLSADGELAFYRILQEALKNVGQHANARQVTVRLVEADSLVQLAIGDDGIGFDPSRRPDKRKGKAGLGLLGMRERARGVGGTLTIKSARGTGTEIEVRIPLAARAGAEN